MKKVTSDEFFTELLKNTSFPSHYTRDAVYDIARINELEKVEQPYRLEIFYRECGTWILDHMSEHSLEKQGQSSMKSGSIFSVIYEKVEITGKYSNEYEYYMSGPIRQPYM